VIHPRPREQFPLARVAQNAASFANDAFIADSNPVKEIPRRRPRHSPPHKGPRFGAQLSHPESLRDYCP
jgi:hypothetical protein